MFKIMVSEIDGLHIIGKAKTLEKARKKAEKWMDKEVEWTEANRAITDDGGVVTITEMIPEAPTPTTCGIFLVKHHDEPDFSYVGSSKQIEICYRDYLSWADRGKAPKPIQEVYSQHGKTGFHCEVVIECDPENLKMYKQGLTPEQVSGTEEAPTPEPEPEVTDIAERNRKILEALAAGETVGELAEKFGVSKSLIYKIKREA